MERSNEFVQRFNNGATDAHERGNVLMALLAWLNQGGSVPTIELDESLAPLGARSIVQRLNRRIRSG